MQIDELRRASRYAKFKNVLQPYRVGTMVNNMRSSIMLDAMPVLPQGIEFNDPKDAFLLTMAGEADYLVTGDHRAGLLQRDSIGRTRIITPAAFADSAAQRNQGEHTAASICRKSCLKSPGARAAWKRSRT